MSYYRNALGYAKGEYRTWANMPANTDKADTEAAYIAAYGED
jgi:hypothetical protein